MARKNVIEKNFTYFSIIKEAITVCAEEKATSAQIFEYMMKKHPECFTQLNSVTWKNNVRQLLSKCPEFVKTKKEKTSKLHYWKFVEYKKLLEEDYLRNPERYYGNYNGLFMPTPRQTLNYAHDAKYADYDARVPGYFAEFYAGDAPLSSGFSFNGYQETNYSKYFCASDCKERKSSSGSSQ